MQAPGTGLFVRAGLVLLCGATAFAQKTVVTVEKGRIRAETTGGTVIVAAGQKAVLAGGEKPLAGVNEPMVEHLIALSKWIDAERQAKRIPIESATIQIVAVESDNRFKAAVLFESVNRDKEPRSTDRIGNISGAIQPRFYDMEGKLLQADERKTGEDSATYLVHFPESIPPGSLFRYVLVSDMKATGQSLWRDGKIWHFAMSNGSPKALNFFRFILPKSAILIGTSSRPVLVDETDGRVAVTLRDYTGADSGAEHVLFLWPGKDGTSLADVPPEYRGGRDAWKASVQDQYRDEMKKIMAGQDYNDQSTPLAALLTRNAAIVRNDRDRLLATAYAPTAAEREKVQSELQRLETELGGMKGVRELLVDTVEVVSTPPWAQNPPEGTVHEIDTYGRGSQTRNFTTGLIFHGGKWYVAFNRPGPGLPTDSIWAKQHPKPRPTTGPAAARSAEVTREYQAQMERIRSGADYNDQSTPLAALLTRNAAIVHNNRQRLIATAYAPGEREREAVREEIEGLEKELGGMEGLRKQVVDPVGAVSTPEWPKQPREGTKHLIEMYGNQPGESLPVFTLGLVFHDGKWYVAYNRPGPGYPKAKGESPPPSAPGK